MGHGMRPVSRAKISHIHFISMIMYYYSAAQERPNKHLHCIGHGMTPMSRAKTLTFIYLHDNVLLCAQRRQPGPSNTSWDKIGPKEPKLVARKY
eukprot:scaffold48076_cov58-Attheya_sp.AAC.1